MKPHIIDLHQDLLLHINDRQYYGDHWQTDFDMLTDQQVRVCVATAFPVPPQEDWFHPTANDIIENDFVGYLKKIKEDDRFYLVQNRADLKHCMTSNVTGIIMHIEGLNVFNGTALDWQRLEKWYEMGWRSLGPVWTQTNELGGGTNDSTTRLSLLGAQMIEWLQSHHMIVDCAHMNRPTFWDAVRLIRHPLYISHGNCDACCSSPRNYTDKQLRAVAKSGGIAGVFCAKSYVTGKQSEKATITDVIAHIDHMKNIMGEDHIALGTDFGGIISGFVKDLDALDKLPNLWAALESHGYSWDQIEKIASKNAYRILFNIL